MTRRYWFMMLLGLTVPEQERFSSADPWLFCGTLLPDGSTVYRPYRGESRMTKSTNYFGGIRIDAT